MNVTTGERVLGEWSAPFVRECDNPFPYQCEKTHAERGDTLSAPGDKQHYPGVFNAVAQ